MTIVSGNLMMVVISTLVDEGNWRFVPFLVITAGITILLFNVHID